ncbi:MAG: hypothetical protein ACRD2Y_10220 [Terriglobales bacterium]
MARCPRCALSALPYSRCDRCGLMLGFDGLTILLDFHDTPAFQRVRAFALRQPSCSEWTREDGSRYLHVTYSFSEVARFNQLAAAAARLSGKRAFVNGLEIPWPAAFDVSAFYGDLDALSRPRPKTRALASVPG